MNYVFWFTADKNIYWHGIIMAVAITATIIAAAGFRRLQNKPAFPVYLASAIALPLGYILSRFTYWYFNKESFTSLKTALFSPNIGGNSIFGAAFGVLFALIIVRFVCNINDFSALLDAAAPASMLGICIGRLSGFFSLDDRGKIIEDPSLQRFPFAIYDEYEDLWHLSVFALEAIAAGLIFVASLLLFLFVYTGRNKRIGGGNVLLITLLLFGATQGPLEGMRLDSVFMNSLGFVRIMQIASLILIVFVFVYYSVTSIKAIGLRLWHPVMWAVSAGLLVLAFFMEFRIHSTVFVRNYVIMITCLLYISVIAGRMFAMTYSEPQEKTGLMLPLSRHR